MTTENVKFESKLINKLPTHESVEEGEIQSCNEIDQEFKNHLFQLGKRAQTFESIDMS